jgi:molybdate/tungstate transport system substrate-binding protein
MPYRHLFLAALLLIGICASGCAPTAPVPTAPPTPVSVPTLAPQSTPQVSPTLTAPPTPAASATPAGKTPLVVFAAGSLIRPFDDLAKAFQAKYPNIEVQSEYHGSIQVIRHVTELHMPIDVVATADYALIPQLMYANTVPETGRPYASSYIRFATNTLGLAYSAKSRYADEINADNWMDILTRPDVKIGIADPRFDASGYRALMVFKLAESLSPQPSDLFNQMFDNQFTHPLLVSDENGVTAIRVPEILETRKDAHVVLRGASIQLIALIESGDLDYAFEYESVIRQHGLQLVHLPDSLNLGSPNQAAIYSRVMIRLDFKRFASVKPEFKGEQIGYGITIPSNAPHPEAAAQFIAFLLGPEGQKIMEADHQPLLNPAVGDHFDQLPAELKPLCVAGP